MSELKTKEKAPKAIKNEFTGRGKIRSQSFGRKLQNTLIELKKANVNDITSMRNAKIQAVRNQKSDIHKFVENMMNEIVLLIEYERVPYHVVDTFDMEQWVLEAFKGTAIYQEFWDGFVDFMNQHELNIKKEYIEAYPGSLRKVLSVYVEPFENLEKIDQKLDTYSDGTLKTYYPGRPWLNQFGYPHRSEKCSCGYWECDCYRS
jgi:hypothetical protein